MFDCLEVFNVLCDELIIELIVVFGEFECDVEIGCVILIGFKKVFVVGVDIKEF